MAPVLRTRNAKQKLIEVGLENRSKSLHASNRRIARRRPTTSSKTIRSPSTETACSSGRPSGVNDSDVLCGRGKGSYEWKGNKLCKKLIASRIPVYMAATKNKDKIRITREIVHTIQKKGGRFLGIDNASGAVYEVSDNEARLKVSQALRHRRSLISEDHQVDAAKRCLIGTSKVHATKTPCLKKVKSKEKQPLRSPPPPTCRLNRSKMGTLPKASRTTPPLTPLQDDDGESLDWDFLVDIGETAGATVTAVADEDSYSYFSCSTTNSDEEEEEDDEYVETTVDLGEDPLEGEMVYDELSMKELNLDNFEWVDESKNDDRSYAMPMTTTTFFMVQQNY